jgi:hypothetical protein
MQQTPVHLSHDLIHSKLVKAMHLASNSEMDRFFEIKKHDDYFTKDAMDNKHGYYFLRVGAENEKYDLNLRVKMYVKGDQLESMEDARVFTYKYPDDKFSFGDYKLTTSCEIRPEQGKNTCDFLVPTTHHDRTQVFIERKTKVGTDVEEPISEPKDTDVNIENTTSL